MDIVKIVSIGVISAIAIMLIKQIKPDFAIMLLIASSVLIMFWVVELLSPVISNLTNIIEKTGINSALISSILKIIGIGYITEFGASVCQDSGCSSIADKVQLAGKCFILIVGMPIISELINIVAGLLP